TKRATADELRTKQTLEELLARYDLAPFTFTNRVRIDERATPHSHPVLTLSTRFMVRSVDGVVADYLHEQLHRYVSSMRAQSRAANRAWREMFGKVPRRRGGGASTRRSTLLHLTVNWLECEGLCTVLGIERASDVLDAKVDGPVYPWVYRQVRDNHEQLAAVLERTGLAAVVNKNSPP
ncbi:MAG: hypothetical protein QOF21_1079, partial [Actinomycetota bacterium]